VSKTPKIDEKQRCILAAILAVSNLGMGRPEPSRVAEAKASPYCTTLQDAVIKFGQQYMESDEHEEIFMLEARGFYRDLGPKRLAGSMRAWRDLFDMYEKA